MPAGDAVIAAIEVFFRIGCLSAGAIETSFREEAVTDLFGEQIVLCGGAPQLVKAAFETLVEAGYSPEVAYLECLHELKIIADLMYQGGVRFMRDRISRTAAWGSFETGDKVVSPEVKQTMKSALERIQSGEFATGWLEEEKAGQKRLKEKIEQEARHPIEKAGRRVRSLMPYLNDDI